MTRFNLILRNLSYYRKTYFSILAGTVLSTAVLTGALVVGDSVRYSLGQLTEIRLGKTRFVVQSGDRFFSQNLANKLTEKLNSPVAPVLQLEGLALNSIQNTQINRVEVLGIDERFMSLWNASTVILNGNSAILNRYTADKLNLKPGDDFLLKVRKQAKASANAPFVSEKEPLATMRLKVAAIADDNQMGRFSLKSNQSAPFNIFVSLKILSQKVSLKGNANLLLFADNEMLNSQNLDSLIRLCWQTDDAGLVFKPITGTEQYDITSSRIFIDDNTSKAIQSVVPKANPILTYLVNAILFDGKSTPYSFVSAVGKEYLGYDLSDREIIVSSWLAADLGVKTGDSVTLRYFKMGLLRKLTEDSCRFCIKSILPITEPVFDPALMPEFPGMSDAGNCRDWETGAPVDLAKIRDKDEKYWNQYRGTPKAFISIDAGEKLWDNAFGHATSFRIRADSATLPIIEKKIMNQLTPSENGLVVRDIYSEGKSAAANSTDFGGLFLSLSFFIITAALLLIALLFSLHAQKRMAETATMAALGFRNKDIIRILFAEASLVIIAGSMVGTILGIGYNNLILLGLNTLWHDAVGTSMLLMHIQPSTLLTGFIIGVVTALLVLFFILKRNLRKPLSVMVKGVDLTVLKSQPKQFKISLVIAILTLLFAMATIAYSLFALQSWNAEIFLSAGGMMLISGIAWLYFFLLRASQKTSNTLPGFFTLILRNANLKRRRTLTAIALLAIGTFSVIITGANRKTFYGTETSNQSGTGGFLLWVETTVPILNDLNSQEGKDKYGLGDEPFFKNTAFIQLLRLDGNDASCLNLNQVSQPAVLGIHAEYFDKKQAFSFLNLESSVDNQHPWLSLHTQLSPGVIPAYADQTVIQWGLRKKVGDTLLYRDETGKQVKVKLIGGLSNSVFQGNILVSAELMRQYFPSAAVSKVMLVEGDYTQRKEITNRLEYLFQDYGMMATPASERLAQFNAVENTYLSVFMMLGGLGMLIGTIGLGIVLLRNLAERKQETALYLALGFKQNYITKLLFAENLLILLTGIGIGTVAAFAGILPSFLSPAFQLPATFLLVIIALILLNGILWIYFPVKSALKKNLIQSLRKE